MVFGTVSGVWEAGFYSHIIRGPQCDSGPELYVSEHPFSLSLKPGRLS